MELRVLCFGNKTKGGRAASGRKSPQGGTLRVPTGNILFPFTRDGRSCQFVFFGSRGHFTEWRPPSHILYRKVSGGRPRLRIGSTRLFSMKLAFLSVLKITEPYQSQVISSRE